MMNSSDDAMAAACFRRPDSPALCIKGCGFFGSASNMNMCSKCYREFQKESAEKEVQIPANPPQVPTLTSALASDAVNVVADSVVKNRCLSCNKRVGLTGFKCRCGSTFCSMHRYPEKHECSFDFKAVGRAAIQKANPLVVADKLERF